MVTSKARRSRALLGEQLTMGDKMALITDELLVGITSEMKDAITVVCAVQGLKPSQFGRMVLLEKLMALQMMQHPGKAIAEDYARAQAVKANAD
jgi:hypothetical protein